MHDFIILKNGVCIATLKIDGTLFPLSGISQELAHRLTATLLAGLPEGERMEHLLRRLADGSDNSVPVAKVLSELADLSGGLEILHVGQSKTPLRYVPPPELPELVLDGGAYHEPHVEMRLARKWYDAGGRIRELQPHPSFGGVQDKFTAVAERRDGKLVLRPAEEYERGNVLIKPHRSDIPFMAETEFICMHTARLCGLSAADCFLFESPIQGRRDIRVMDLAVLRFDRNPDGTMREVTDLAALIGLEPDRKYSMSRKDMLTQAGYFLPPAELTHLTEALFFGTLIGNGDMHLKNFSVVRTSENDTWRFAPLYDMLSTEALRYEARLGLPIDKNAYAILSRQELEYGRASMEKLQDIAMQVEMVFPSLAKSVLTASERPHFFTTHSLVDRMTATMRKRIAAVRAELTAGTNIEWEREDTDCEGPAR